MSPAKYLLLLLLALLALTVPVAAFNLQQDPYDIYAQVQAGPQPVKLDTNLRMAKAYAIRSYAPDCLIFGNSRAEIGYRAAELPKDCARPYNGAVPGGRIYESRRYLQHALAFGEIKHVLLAVDFEMFAAAAPTAPDFTEPRLAVSAAGGARPFPAGELVGLALGREASGRSLQLWRKPVQHLAVAASGDRNDEYLRKVVFVRNLGLETREQLMHLRVMIGGNGRAFEDQRGRAALREYQNFLDLCREHRISLRVLFNPVHASVHAFYRHMGLEAQTLQWKAQMAEITAAAAAGGQDVQLWDFARVNEVTGEDIDLNPEGMLHMKNYWDPSHFRAPIGARVLREVYEGEAAGLGGRVNGAVDGERLKAELTGWSSAHATLDQAIGEWERAARR